ncbi:MAG: hypothetical protein IK078_01650 [Lachnospiraceae bacterium]|nr:hypothetical protein [Lachnospiraceae bacterium]
MSERIGCKVYVDVGAEFTSDGMLRPQYLIWEDGRKYEIDKIRKIERCASRRGGGAGILYQCMICGKPVRLFYEENYRWFLESNQPNQ